MSRAEEQARIDREAREQDARRCAEDEARYAAERAHDADPDVLRAALAEHAAEQWGADEASRAADADGDEVLDAAEAAGEPYTPGWSERLVRR